MNLGHAASGYLDVRTRGFATVPAQGGGTRQNLAKVQRVETEEQDACAARERLKNPQESRDRAADAIRGKVQISTEREMEKSSKPIWGDLYQELHHRSAVEIRLIH